jgi:hypothetical protein
MKHLMLTMNKITVIINSIFQCENMAHIPTQGNFSVLKCHK